MTTARIAPVLLGILIFFPLTTQAGTVLAVFTDREAFEMRLGSKLRLIGFDDIETEEDASVEFEPARYAKTTGAIVTGHTDGGQFVSRHFGFPKEFIPSSAPNMYAPGPIAAEAKGERVTSVTFSVRRGKGAVAGFGAVFIDADHPGQGPSYIEAFDADGELLGTTGRIAGPDASRIFRGIVAVDVESGKPVAVIATVRIVSGNEWPQADSSEGAALDDFVFSRPKARARKNRRSQPKR